jgi:hypothetical protein
MSSLSLCSLVPNGKAHMCLSCRDAVVVYSNDHEPPHFHAKRKGEWEYRINFLQSRNEMFELIWATKKARMSRADRELLQDIVEEHRFEILGEWEQKVNRHES